MKNWWMLAAAVAGATAIGALCWKKLQERELDSTQNYIEEAEEEMRKIELKLLTMDPQSA